MNDPVKYKRLTELVTELGEKLDELNIGKLSREELESLTEHSRELYERLVVLRFKAYDHEVKDQKSGEKSAPPIPFKVTDVKTENVPVNQVSLMDIIEEVTQAVPKSEPEVLSEPVHTTPSPVIESAPVNKQASVLANTATGTKESLHEKLTRTMGVQESLGEKMETAPIKDLKKAISLNQRFQFSKELFRGNNQEYEMAIDRLNSSGRVEALNHLEILKIKYSWNSESTITVDFVELVERRHH